MHQHNGVVQTLHFLHKSGGLAHLDITSNNVMLRKDGYKAWDQLRLLDFGFCQFCNPGRVVRNQQIALPAACSKLLWSACIPCAQLAFPFCIDAL